MSRNKNTRSPSSGAVGGPKSLADAPTVAGHLAAQKSQKRADLPGPPSAPAEPAAIVLAGLFFLAPALGAPNELLLQDTLKSIVIAFGALVALGVWAFGAWRATRMGTPVGPHSASAGVMHWHPVLILPLMLMAYALGSMAWSHAYLAGGEAIRWFLFAVLLWVGMNVARGQGALCVVRGIHAGAIVASLWTALQFWFDFGFFAQGPNPASTFVNRNFFAEFLICTLPLSLWLAATARGSMNIALHVFFVAFNAVALLMTGTRSALLALGVMICVLPVIYWRTGASLALSGWTRPQRWLAASVFGATFLGLGSLPCGNAAINADNMGHTAIERSLKRTASMGVKEEYTERSFSIRAQMWQATGRMIRDTPLTGVGAGAWEVQIPLYQAEGTQIETDYYAHNEPLQLVAEYGLVGWAFLFGLTAFFLSTAARTWRLTAQPTTHPTQQSTAQPTTQPTQHPSSHSTQYPAPQTALRAFVLLSLLALMIVSCAGFAWRMATTGALFAMLLALLAGSDVRWGVGQWVGVRFADEPRLQLRATLWTRGRAVAVMALALAAGALALVISQRAVVAENQLVGAAQIALSVGNSENPDDPRWAPLKADMLEKMKHGIDANPHYRKLATLTADEMARWGDWPHAVEIWETVIRSRPYVVVILGNVARGYLKQGAVEQARSYQTMARAVQPQALAVQSFDVMLLAHEGQDDAAQVLIRAAFASKKYDLDLVNAAYALAVRKKDWPMAINVLQRRANQWPHVAAESWMALGDLYASAPVQNEDAARAAYQAALIAVPPEVRTQMLQQIPPQFRPK